MWHSTEDIEDPDYREFVEDSCCEEFMIYYLSEVFNNWAEWWVEGDEDEDGNEIPPDITINENMQQDYDIQTYITLDAEELTLLGVVEEYWDDYEVINNAIHSMIYEKRNENETY